MMSVLTFASNHLDKAALVYQVAESASFYIQNKSPQLYEKLVKTRDVFNKASVAVGALCFAQLFYQMEVRWSLLYNITFVGGRLSNSDIQIPLIFIGLVGGAYITVGTLIAAGANRLFRSKEDPQTYLPEDAPADIKAATKVEWARSSTQTFTQTSLATRALLHISLAYLAPTRSFLIATIFLQVVSLIATARWQTLKYERTFTSFNQGPEQIKGVMDRIQKVTISYFRPILPAMNHRNEECLCGVQEMNQICSEHAACKACIVGSIYSAMERFSNPELWFWTKNFEPQTYTTHIDSAGRIDRVVYQVNINRHILPSCPTCRDQPGYGELEVAIEDITKPGQLTPAEVTLVT